jgi:hypothetical protein
MRFPCEPLRSDEKRISCSIPRAMNSRYRRPPLVTEWLLKATQIGRLQDRPVSATGKPTLLQASGCPTSSERLTADRPLTPTNCCPRTCTGPRMVHNSAACRSCA